MRTFSARETVWLQELDGIELAGFWRRAFALGVDSILASLFLSLVVACVTFGYLGVRKLEGHDVKITDVNQLNAIIGDKAHVTINTGPHAAASPTADKSHIHYSLGDPEPSHPRTLLSELFHIFTDIVVPILYFGLFLWQGNGRTPGKRLCKIRVVSLVHTHMSFWHSVERALGYGAAALEGGFGFVQYFLHPYRRCAQDRLAETIVVTERSYQQRFPERLGTPSEADTAPQASAQE